MAEPLDIEMPIAPTTPDRAARTVLSVNGTPLYEVTAAQSLPPAAQNSSPSARVATNGTGASHGLADKVIGTLGAVTGAVAITTSQNQVTSSASAALTTALALRLSRRRLRTLSANMGADRTSPGSRYSRCAT